MPTPSHIGDDPALDEVQALQNLGGNETLFLKMAKYFLTYSEELLRPMYAAKSAGDWPRLREANHKLMGSVVNFGRNRAFHAARRLETALDAHQLAGVEAEFQSVNDAVRALNAALRRRLSGVDLSPLNPL